MQTTIILVAGVVAVAGLALWMAVRSAKSSGKAEANKEHAEATVERANNASKNRDRVKSMSDDELNSSLQRDR